MTPSATEKNSAVKIRFWQRRPVVVTGCVIALVAATMLVRGFTGGKVAEAQQAPAEQAEASLPKHERPKHDVMAIVNGQDISRQKLADACVERYGEEVLESIVNKRLIEHHCRKRNITITRAEIDEEIERMAKRFKLSREHWLELLERERGIKADEYSRDILWPTLALRELASNELTVGEEELTKEYESRYGATVRARLILVENKELADKLQRELTARPDDFARIAMTQSKDVNSASIGGLIQPIRMHVGEPAIERVAFQLQQNQISPVIPIGEQFVILKCEGHDPARTVAMEAVREELSEGIKEGKLRQVANQLFGQLQSAAVIQNIYNDPRLSQTMPGVVATVNGEQVTMKELGSEALLRHGEEVLDQEISHLLLEQSLKTSNVTVTQQDLDAEIAHAAKLAGVVDAQGNPDIKKWTKTATEEQRVSFATYIRDSVWPSTALKKLTSENVQVTGEDLQKGFDANYGERVRCRAIVLSNMRRAQEVWDKARSNESLDYFGDLAAEYSIEPTSRSLRGEVPPVRRFGGQPQLEEIAFQLNAGDLSGIVQVGDKFVIMKCEGRTKPVEVNMATVKDVLSQDIYEKKIRVAMGQRYEQIRSQARIDNYLAGTSQAPPAKQGGQVQGRRDTAVKPTAGVR